MFEPVDERKYMLVYILKEEKLLFQANIFVPGKNFCTRQFWCIYQKKKTNCVPGNVGVYIKRRKKLCTRRRL